MAQSVHTFSSTMSQDAQVILRSDIQSLNFFRPNEHVPFKVYDPLADSGTNVVLPSGKSIAIIETASDDTSLWTKLVTAVDSDCVPIVRYENYDYVPVAFDPLNNRMCFMSMLAYNTIGFLEVFSNNTFTRTVRPFIWKQYANVDTDTAETLWLTLNAAGLVILYDSDNNSYMSYHNTGTTYIAYPVCSECKYSKITITRSGSYGAYTYTKSTETPDTIWAHWQNDNGWTTIGDTSLEETLSQTNTVLAEGSLSASARPHLPVGLYRFSMELANHRDADQVAPYVFPFDVKIKYGANTLRAMTFLTDASLGSASLRSTHWCSGIFRMSTAGDVDISVQCSGSGGKHSQFKMSHLFINQIGA